MKIRYFLVEWLLTDIVLVVFTYSVLYDLQRLSVQSIFIYPLVKLVLVIIPLLMNGLFIMRYIIDYSDKR